MLCLWSFDMLRSSSGTAITDRAMSMLADTTFLNAYINNALIPMVRALKGHPAIIAWEIFNEPEGMSNEFGWDFNRHVPMAAIRRFHPDCHRERMNEADIDSSIRQMSEGDQIAVCFVSRFKIPRLIVNNSLTYYSELTKINFKTGRFRAGVLIAPDFQYPT